MNVGVVSRVGLQRNAVETGEGVLVDTHNFAMEKL